MDVLILLYSCYLSNIFWDDARGHGIWLITISLGAFIMGRAGTNDLMSLGGKFLVYIGLGTLAFGYLYAEFGLEIFPHGHSNPAEDSYTVPSSR